MKVHEASDVQVGTAESITVTPHHCLCQPLETDWQPERSAQQMPRYRNLSDGSSELRETPCRRSNPVVDVRLRTWKTEALFQHRNLQAFNPAFEQLRIR